MLKKIILYFLFINMYIFSNIIGNGIGDMDIQISVNTENKTKKYYVNEKLVLDTGVYNAESRNIPEQRIATIIVKMQTKKSQNSDINTNDPQICIIDSEFNIPYELKKLSSEELNDEVSLSDIKDYYNGNGLDITLREKNFKINKMDVMNEDSKDPSYTFTAYPDECRQINQEVATNLVSYLEYQFELWLTINEIRNDSIIGYDILIERENNEVAIGTVEDLVKGHFIKMQN